MAFTRNPTSPRELSYAAIISYSGDKGDDRTSVHVGLYYDREHRASRDPALAPPIETRCALVEGFGLTLAEVYTALSTLPEWEGWESDER